MPPRKRTATADGDAREPVAKRRSSRQAASAAAAQAASSASSTPAQPPKKRASAINDKAKEDKTSAPEEKSTGAKSKVKQTKPAEQPDAAASSRAVSEDPDPDSIPKHNPEVERHSGQWYWLMKAEPESRFEDGVDVRFSIDDLRARTKPEGWDGIRAYAARNNLRAMNAGDMAFFYHSNCKTPGIVGTMEIVREYSEDKSARRPGPYYDPSSSKTKQRWGLVHVEFRRKFAVPIPLPELRELGKPGGPLEDMQMLRQSRLSVSKVSGKEWRALCELADKKAKDAGLDHEDA